jgi:hypothetical protein
LKQADLKDQDAERDAINLTELISLDPVEANIDTAAIHEQANTAIATNKNVEVKKQLDKLTVELNEKKATHAQLTTNIDTNIKARADAISSAAMPVVGLSFGNGEVLFNGLPLGNASSAEQLKVSVGIAMAANPELKVLRIKDGSLLDEGSLQQLAEMTHLAGYQVWIERVEESQHGGPVIVMDDGTVVPSTDQLYKGSHES